MKMQLKGEKCGFFLTRWQPITFVRNTELRFQMKIRLKFKCHCRRSVEWSSSRSQSLRQQSTSDVTWLILNPFVNGHLAPTHGLQKLIAIRQMLTVLLRPVLSPSSCQNVGVEGLARKLQKKLTPFAPPLNSNNKLYTTGQVCHIDSSQRDMIVCVSLSSAG